MASLLRIKRDKSIKRKLTSSSYICKVILLICVTIPSARSTGHCLTWEDEQQVIVLKCRGATFPVSFYSSDETTVINCTKDHWGEMNCSPLSELKLSKAKIESDGISISLEKETIGINYEGTWKCKHGTNVLETRVSLTDGIITDSWVQLTGQTIQRNRMNYITLACSSCRKPHGSYVEFLLNGVSQVAVRRDKNGICRRNQHICTGESCSCSESGNIFVIRQQPQSLEKGQHFSCELHFEDTVRGGRFSITATSQFNGDDFKVIEYTKHIIVENRKAEIYSVTKTEVDNEHLASTTMVQTHERDKYDFSNNSGLYMIMYFIITYSITILILIYIVLKCIRHT